MDTVTALVYTHGGTQKLLKKRLKILKTDSAICPQKSDSVIIPQQRIWLGTITVKVKHGYRDSARLDTCMEKSWRNPKATLNTTRKC